MKPTTTIEPYHDRQTFLEKLLFPIRKIRQQKLADKVEGKTILITGASYGIGARLTEILSDHPVKLILLARTTERLSEIKESYKDKACTIDFYSLDIRKEEQIKDLLEKWEQAGISINLFINNAGKSINRGLISSLGRYDDTRRCSATNYTGPVQLLMGLLPGLMKNKGQIINVSAQNVLLPPTAGWSAYQSSKVAFDQWLRCMEPELRGNGVMVSSVYLPLVRTRMSMVNEKNHSRPAMSAVKAARAILNCVTHTKRKYRPWWTGIPVFAANLFPNGWYRLQLRHFKKKK